MKDRKLRIGSTFYDFKVLPMQSDHGESHPDQHYVKIGDHLNPMMSGRTLFHEIAHMGLAEYCQVRLKEEDEEKIISAIESAFAGLALDEYDTFLEMLNLMRGE